MKVSTQTLYIAGAVILLAVLYLGFDNKPSSQKALEKSRAMTAPEFDITTLRAEATTKLREEETEYLETLEAQIQHAGADSVRLGLLKQLSGFWFSLGQPLLAGTYARQVAEAENTAESWSIAGTTFASGFQITDLDPKQKGYVREQALRSFENAISLEPKVVDHRVNQALCFIEAPEDGQPMKGIQMLAGLATEYPDSPVPPYHLARLAVRTGQYDRAATRIEQALALAPSDSRIACLAKEIYTALQRTEDASKVEKVCAGKK